MRCYGGEPIESACTDLSDHFVEMRIDKEAILEYLEGLTESEVRDVILGVKGIGSKKAEDIVKALTKAQKERS